MTGWLTIDSAPRDGLRGDDFLGYLDDGMGGWLDLCCWSGQHEEFMPRQCVLDPTLWREDCRARGTRITHWQPLPPPPQS
jgi:hypothetical protein